MTLATTHDALSRDAFAERYFGKPVYRLTDVARAAPALDALAGTGPYLVHAKVPTTDVRGAASLTALGFSVVDSLVEFDAPSGVIAGHVRGRAPGGVRVRDAEPADRSHVERVAADNMISRFHLDPDIERHQASAFKAAWAGNFFDGRRGNRLLVATKDGVVGGFLLTLEQGDEGRIDLIALDAPLRGSGALEALIDGWLDRAPALRRLIVGTQISNVRSQRAYGRLGWRVSQTAFLLHRHGGRPA